MFADSGLGPRTAGIPFKSPDFSSSVDTAPGGDRMDDEFRSSFLLLPAGKPGGHPIPIVAFRADWWKNGVFAGNSLFASPPPAVDRQVPFE